ncbi:unnamed protein product, partial [Staurois parvus]
QTFTFYNLGLKLGHSVEVKGFIPEDCEVFAIILGTDEKNLVLHFSPRFDYEGVQLMIVMNSMVDNVWEKSRGKVSSPSRRDLTPWLASSLH